MQSLRVHRGEVEKDVIRSEKLDLCLRPSSLEGRTFTAQEISKRLAGKVVARRILTKIACRLKNPEKKSAPESWFVCVRVVVDR